MKPDDLISAVKDPDAWRLQSSAMRRSAEALWDKFSETVLVTMGAGVTDDALFDVSLQYMQTSKLLYGLALETAFKALIVASSPQDIDLLVSMDGTDKLNDVEVRSLGVPSSKGHDLVALAEKAGIFGPAFDCILVDARGKDAFRKICRHLSEMVVWRGRYPAPMRSFDPIELDPTIPTVVIGHYMRDCPMLDAMGVEGSHTLARS